MNALARNIMVLGKNMFPSIISKLFPFFHHFAHFYCAGIVFFSLKT